MNILQISTEQMWTGGERQNWYQIKGLLKAKKSVEVLCLKDYPLYEKLKKIKVVIHPVKNSLQAFLFLAKYGKEYDLLHSQTPSALDLCSATRPFHHRSIVHTQRFEIPTNILNRFRYSLADHIVPISKTLCPSLQQLGMKKMTVIPDIIEKKKLNHTRAEKLLERLQLQNKKVIATIASFIPSKDPWTMVAAIQELLKIRKDFVFLHFGEGILRSEIEELLRKEKLDSYYRIMGLNQNVEDYFHIFDVFAMSSTEEGLGSNVLDAFIYGVPVVSTDAGGLSEIVKDCGILCTVKNPKGLAKGMNQLLEDSSLRNDYIQKGDQRATQGHESSLITKRYLDLFTKLMIEK